MSVPEAAGALCTVLGNCAVSVARFGTMAHKNLKQLSLFMANELRIWELDPEPILGLNLLSPKQGCLQE